MDGTEPAPRRSLRSASASRITKRPMIEGAVDPRPAPPAAGEVSRDRADEQHADDVEPDHEDREQRHQDDGRNGREHWSQQNDAEGFEPGIERTVAMGWCGGCAGERCSPDGGCTCNLG